MPLEYAIRRPSTRSVNKTDGILFGSRAARMLWAALLA